MAWQRVRITSPVSVEFDPFNPDHQSLRRRHLDGHAAGRQLHSSSPLQLSTRRQRDHMQLLLIRHIENGEVIP